MVGVIAGGSFSGLLPIAFRGRDVLSLKSAPFVLGGLAAGLILSVLAPGPAWIGGLLGASTAGGTLSVAKMAARHELGSNPSARAIESDDR
ncbi:MAG: hypothetical protein AAF389_15820 [Gemmatimonadota bacterium]